MSARGAVFRLWSIAGKEASDPLSQYDTIVIGAGHNGLVCAALLAGKGQKVLVLEAGKAPGGLACTREFHPGFRTGLAHTVSHFSPEVAAALNLSAHGYQAPGTVLDTIALDPEGGHVVIGDETLAGAGSDDADRYRDYRSSLKRFAKALQPFWLKTMPRIGNNRPGELLTFAQLGLRMRLLGREDMLEFLRVATLPMRDLLDEYFEHDRLKAALAWDGLVGMRMAPRSPNNSVFALLYRMATDVSGMHCIPSGGVEGLVHALESSASSAGADIRYDSPVQRVLVEGDESGQRVAGVELAGGDVASAQRVVSSADPRRTFLDLVGARHLEIEFTGRIQRLRCEGYVAKLHLALSGLPTFTGLDHPAGRLIIAPHMDSLEFAYDDAKYGRLPAAPVLECVLPTVQLPELAPAGQHILSAQVMYVPARLEGGWTEEAKASLLNRLLAILQDHAPGLGDMILHAELLTPEDIEREYRVTGGHWHHTEFAVDQMLMMRPTYEAGQYRTPIPGLFLCGAGSHPGGDLTGAPGFNAAREILR